MAALLCVTYATTPAHVHTTKQKLDTRTIEDMWLTEQSGICKKSVKTCQKSVGELLAMQGFGSFHESYLGHAGKYFCLTVSGRCLSTRSCLQALRLSVVEDLSSSSVLITTHGFRVSRRFPHTDCAFI